MGITMRTYDLNTVPIGIGKVLYSASQLIVVGGPAAAGAELVFGVIEWGITATADVGAFGFIVVVLAGEGHLGALVGDDALFVGA